MDENLYVKKFWVTKNIILAKRGGVRKLRVIRVAQISLKNKTIPCNLHFAVSIETGDDAEAPGVSGRATEARGETAPGEGTAREESTVAD